jgi:glycosyltransferase involved in cell wall biosynthesis
VVPLRHGDSPNVKRVVLLTEIPAPYRIPLFNALAKQVDLEVVFLARRNPERPYELHEQEMRFQWHVLPHRAVSVGGRWLVLNHSVLRALRRADVVVLGGWNQPAFWLAMVWAAMHRVPLCTWVESTSQDIGAETLAPLKRLLLATSAAVFVPGNRSAALVRELGIDADRIVIAPNAVDVNAFATSVARRKPSSCCRFLYVGRLAREKGVDILLQAFSGLEADLVVAGIGPEERLLRSLAPPGVRFIGHVQRDALIDVYAGADVLVLPSRREPWGMTLNEGAAAGLALIASDAAGATDALIDDGANGFRVPAGDVAALHLALRTLADDPILREQMAARSFEIASAYTPERWASTIASTLTGLVGR